MQISHVTRRSWIIPGTALEGEQLATEMGLISVMARKKVKKHCTLSAEWNNCVLSKKNKSNQNLLEGAVSKA